MKLLTGIAGESRLYAIAAAVLLAAPASAQNAKVDITVNASGGASDAGFHVCIGNSTNRALYGSAVTPASGAVGNEFQNVPANQTVLVTVSKGGFVGRQRNVELKPGRNDVIPFVMLVGSGGFTCPGSAVVSPPAPVAPPTPPAAVATFIETVTPSSQAGFINTAVTQPPGVRIRDQNNNPLAGVSVTFAVGEAGGQVLAGTTATASTGTILATINRSATVVSGSDGIARVGTWILGYNAGTYRLTATAGSLASVGFTATAAVPPTPASIAPAISSNYAGAAGKAMTYGLAMTVIVRDQNNNPLPGVNVAFAVTAGGGSVTPVNVTTGADGTAKPTTWMLGTTPGVNTLSATVAGLPPATLTVYGGLTATSITAVSETSQQGIAGSAATVKPAVVVKDQFGNPVSAIPVNFSADAGGSVTPASVSTGSDGIARLTSWILGVTAGTNTVLAKLPSHPAMPPVTFTAIGTSPQPTAPSPTMSISSLDPPVAVPGATFLSALVRVRGAGFVDGMVVRWNGAARTTSFLSSSNIALSVRSADIATAGTANITVFDPTTGSETPARVFFVDLTKPGIPQMTSLGGNTDAVAGSPVSFAINGSGFVIGSVVRVTGSTVPPGNLRYNGPGIIGLTIPGTLIPTAGTYRITVFNPGPNGGESNALQLTVRAP